MMNFKLLIIILIVLKKFYKKKYFIKILIFIFYYKINKNGVNISLDNVFDLFINDFNENDNINK